MKQVLYMFLLMLTAIEFQSCHDELTIDEETLIPDVKVYEEITGNILGIITDEEGEPINEATVSIYSKTTKSNEDGVFEFVNQKMDKRGTYILVNKDGYHYGAAIVYPDRSTVNAKIILLKSQKTRQFLSNEGAGFEFENGGKVIFPGDAIFTEENNLYNGKVYFHCKFYNNDQSEMATHLPIGVLNKKKNGSYSFPLFKQAYLMELRDEAGNILKINPDKEVQITFPKTSVTLPKTAKFSIFSDLRGQWEEYSDPKIINDQYTVAVNHFCFGVIVEDIITVDVCGKIKLPDETPLSNMRILVKIGEEIVHQFYSNGLGEFCVVLPRNYPLTFEVFGSTSCGILHTYTSSPLDTDTNLDAFVLNDLSNLQLNCEVGCNNSNIPFATVVLKMNDEYFLFKCDENGMLNKNVSHLGCSSNTDAR